MTRIKICNEENCHNSATTGGFCRLHYLRNWKKVKEEKRKRAAKKLDKYIESVVKKHPDRYMEVIKKDIRSPGFGKLVDDTFSDDDTNEIFKELTYDEEIEQLLKQLKIEKDF